MNAIDVKIELKKYKKGWVALNSGNKVVEHAMSFESICDRVNKYEDKKNLLIIPASDNYFGFIT